MAGPLAPEIVDLANDSDDDVAEIAVRPVSPETRAARQIARQNRRRNRPDSSDDSDVEILGSHQLSIQERHRRAIALHSRHGMPILFTARNRRNRDSVLARFYGVAPSPGRGYTNGVDFGNPDSPYPREDQGEDGFFSDYEPARTPPDYLEPEDMTLYIRNEIGVATTPTNYVLDLIIERAEEALEAFSYFPSLNGDLSRAVSKVLSVNSFPPSWARLVARRLGIRRQRAISLRDFTLASEDLHRAINNSLIDTDAFKPPDITQLRLPKKPTETREGFTRSLEGSPKIACAGCENEVGVSDETLTSEEARRLSGRIYFRSCGHVYCGKCVHLVNTNSAPFRGCAVTGCKSTSRVKFCQIYH